MSHHDHVVEKLATADAGFVMKNDENGRMVTVLATDRYMYCCTDIAAGISYATSSEDDAVKWLEGTLFAGLNCDNYLQNPSVKLDKQSKEKIRKWREQLAKM